MARIAGVNVPTNKRVEVSLQYIYGIGPAKAHDIVTTLSIPDDRPLVEVDHHTEDLPELPQRDRTIPAERWVEAPPELRELGADFGVSLVAYKRRIGRYLLWRAGPAS